MRLRSFYLIIFVAFLLLSVRLFMWQVLKGKELSAQARGQYQRTSTINAPRGNILASDGSWLVAGDGAWLVYAYIPEMEEDVESVADKLAPLLVEDDGQENSGSRILDEANRIKSILAKDGVWFPLKHKINTETKKQIEALEIGGVGFEAEEARVYPEASSAAHLLGFVGKNDRGEDQGYFGLEGNYDLILSGKPGYLSRESDAKGIPIFLAEAREVSAIDGVDIITSIDKTIQLALETKLEEGIEKYGAAAGSAIVMNPKTGAVLAMTSYPSYDPDEYVSYSDELFKNPIISSSFEPGSIFKILVMAAAIDADAVDADTKCEICGGPLKVDKYYINTWNSVYNPDSTMIDVIVNSDNVGMAFVAQELGADKLYDYLRDFGIGEITGIDLQGEASPALRERGTWNIVDLATTGFGQGVATTPLQMITAASIIANDGNVVTPHLVTKMVGDGWEENVQPEIGKKVLSEKTANTITSMMAEAAKNGEAKWTHQSGFKVAGKTGTAQIPIAGHYDDDKTIASFIGFAPYDDPEFLMLVTLREPNSSPWASETAAPLWYSIARDLFLHFGIQPE